MHVAAAEAGVAVEQEEAQVAHDWYALELIKLPEVGHGRPLRRHESLEYIDRDGGDVIVEAVDQLAARHAQPLQLPARLIDDECGQRRARAHLAAAALDVRLHRGAEPLWLVAVEEGRLRAVGLVDEAVHRREHDGHRQLVRVDKVERLAHRDEDLVVDALGHPIPIQRTRRERQRTISTRDAGAGNGDGWQRATRRRARSTLLLRPNAVYFSMNSSTESSSC